VSDTQSKTVYRMGLQPLDSSAVQHDFTAGAQGDGWDDDFALAFDAAMRALPWPANCPYTGVQKVTTTVVSATPGAGDPPAFQ